MSLAAGGQAIRENQKSVDHEELSMTRGNILIVALFASAVTLGCATGSPAEKTQAAPSLAPAPREISAPQPATAKPVAELAFAQGEVSIRRGANILPGLSAGTAGAALLPFDLISTGKSSRAEIVLNPATASETRLNLGTGTALYFDLSGEGEPRRVRLRLLRGSIDLEALRGGENEFILDAGVAKVRAEGIDFYAESSADGGLLVSCDEGQVSCEGGGSFLARPGTAVEASPDGKLSPKNIPVERLAVYRSSWTVAKETALGKNGAQTALTLFSSLEAGRPAFESAAEGLEAQGPALASWERRLEAGRPFAPDEALSERKAVAAALLASLAALPSFERPYYRLASLADARAAGLALGGSPAEKARLGPLFESFAQGRDEAMLGKLRRALFIFSRLNAATSPIELFGERARALRPGASLLELE
jgi:hypothetical protein